MLVILIYSIFLIIMGYILYKSYYLSLDKLNEFAYYNMSHDIAKLNDKYPILQYYHNIPSIERINSVYNRLGIIDYNDYIYVMSLEFQHGLFSRVTSNSTIQSKVSSVVLADIIHQNSQLYGDLGE